VKLSALNSAIRSLKGAPKINSHYRAAGLSVSLVGLEVQKQSLLGALKVAFPEGRNQETYLRLDANGAIERDEDVWPASEDDGEAFEEVGGTVDDDVLAGLLGDDADEESGDPVGVDIDDLLGCRSWRARGDTLRPILRARRSAS